MSPSKWVLDPAHSELSFKVRHMVISTVTGNFEKFDASIESDSEDFSGAKVTMEADVASINTKNADRDAHLKSPDFFSADAYPRLRFANGILQKSGGEYALEGDLTIRDITKRIRFAVEFNGVAVDPWGNTKAGFELTGKLNRSDYGLSWNTITEAGGVLVSEEVKLIASVQFQKA